MDGRSLKKEPKLAWLRLTTVVSIEVKATEKIFEKKKGLLLSVRLKLLSLSYFDG